MNNETTIVLVLKKLAFLHHGIQNKSGLDSSIYSLLLLVYTIITVTANFTDQWYKSWMMDLLKVLTDRLKGHLNPYSA